MTLTKVHTNIIEGLDGHTLVGGQGSIIQEQITVFPDPFTNTSTSYLQTGMEVVITPKLASSKIVVTSIFTIDYTATNHLYGFAARLYNLNTSAPIGLGVNGDALFYSGQAWNTGTAHLQYAIRAVDDQTNSTALRIYGLAIRNVDGNSGSMKLNDSWGSNTITATEIAQ